MSSAEQKVLLVYAQMSLHLPTHSWKMTRVDLNHRNGGVSGEDPGVRKGQAGTPNTDSPLAGCGQEGDSAQILSSQKKKKMARNRKRESCQLEAG